MSNNNQIHDKDFGSLYQKIFNILVNSPEIKADLLTLLKKGKINPQTVFVLMVKLEEILKAIMHKEVEKMEADTQRIIRKTKNQPLLPKEKVQYIDGRKLSNLEIEFEEYARKSFNEEEWLQKAGIVFP